MRTFRCKVEEEVLLRQVLAAASLSLFLATQAFSYVVNDPGDGPDQTAGDNICATSGSVCTLRAAIEEANAHAGADPITFGIAGTITPATVYPAISGQTNIDGSTAPGFTAAPAVIIEGGNAVTVGLDFGPGSSNSVLSALQLSGFTETGVRVSADTVQIRRNYLGPILSGTANFDGLQLSGTGSIIGGANGNGNVISGNSGAGIRVGGADHIISDNFIGTDPTGLLALGNGEEGVQVLDLSSDITIGSLTAAERNVISGNLLPGVYILDSTGIEVIGNFIGTDATGSNALGNAAGVVSEQPTALLGNLIAGNLISGNDGPGVADFSGAGTIIRNNIIGLDATGTVGIGNLGGGIFLLEATNFEVGGIAANQGNVISDNAQAAIAVLGSGPGQIRGNIVGLSADGSSALGNEDGILILLSTDITIGSAGMGRNIISDNFLGGIFAADSSGLVVDNNYIGTDITGMVAFGNFGTGVEIAAVTGAVARNNIVSSNDGHGIEVTGGSVDTVIHSNTVGLAADLSTPLGNLLDGVNVCDDASGTIVGSASLGGNTIAHNGQNGIGVEPTALLNNSFAANSIHSNTGLGIDLSIDGVTLNDPGDPDTGPNNLQNFPVLVSATSNAAASQISGSIDTTPATAVTVHFYSNAAGDPSGHGEGQVYLGSVSLTTDGSGSGTFAFSGPPVTLGHFISSTATAPDGTSEFSANLVVTATPTDIPTLSTWVMMLLGLALGAVALRKV